MLVINAALAATRGIAALSASASWPRARLDHEHEEKHEEEKQHQNKSINPRSRALHSSAALLRRKSTTALAGISWHKHAASNARGGINGSSLKQI